MFWRRRPEDRPPEPTPPAAGTPPPAAGAGSARSWTRGALSATPLVAPLVAFAVAVGAFGLSRLIPPLHSADEIFGDLLIAHFSPPEAQHPGIVLVTLGEDSFALLACRSPVDRAFLADLIGHLQAAEVRAIGLDILFDQPTLPEHDERLRRRIHEAGVPIVAVTALDQTPLTERQRQFLENFVTGVPHGHANLAKDTADGTVRWHVPVGPDGTLSFPARLAQAVGATVPEEPFRIAWRRGPDPATSPFPIYPAEAVALLPEDWLADRIVLIGTVLVGMDQHRTPLSHRGRQTPGVEIQGHVLAQILDGRSSPRLPVWQEAALVMALSAAGVALAMTGLGVWKLVLASVMLLVLLGVGSAGLLAAGGPLVPLAAPSMAWLGGLALMTAHLALRSRSDRRILMHLFANHVSQPVADEIWRERDTFMSGGRPRPQQLTATVLFSDIEGFTTVCEALPPEPLIRWLEGYLDAMVRIVAAHDGIVLRFIGDAILAVFGVPVPRATQAEIDADAERAVRCALDMGRELEALNRQWQSEGLPPIGIRVGINTGPLVAGSLGGLKHMEYSLLGDTANTAARLEAHAKTVEATSSRHCRIVIGDATWQAVKGRIAALPVGEIALKGKQNRVRTWLVVSQRPAGNLTEGVPAAGLALNREIRSDAK